MEIKFIENRGGLQAFTESGRADFVICVFTRTEVESCDIEPALARLGLFSENNAAANDYAGRMALFFEGYDDDPRELFAIPECVAYFRELTQRFPYWMHFLSTKTPQDSLDIAMKLLVEMKQELVMGDTMALSFDRENLFKVIAQLESGKQLLYQMRGIPRDRARVLDNRLYGYFDNWLRQ